MGVTTYSDVAETPTVPASPVRGLELIIGLDLWLVNPPTIGLSAFVWALLPKRQQEAVSGGLGGLLERQG
jgi:hypothetical protein